MAFTKFASFEVSEILDVKGSPQRQRTASLDKFSDFADYRTEDGYMYARIRAISSRVNKNNDGWPSVELAGSPDIFDKHTSSEGFTVEASKERKYGFSTFVGKPIFVDHNNTDPSRARGVIVDAKFHVDDAHTASHDPYYSSGSADPEHLPPAWVELLLEIDADRFPRLAKAIKEGSKDPSKGIDGFSMGCDVEKTICNICKNAATAPDEFCEHIRLKGATFDYRDSSGSRTSKKSYENCYGIKFFEISAVFDPADETALLRELIQKEGSTKEADAPIFNQPDLDDVMKLAQQYIDKNVDPATALEMAERTLQGRLRTDQVAGGDGASAPHQLTPSAFNGQPADTVGRDWGEPRQGSFLQAKRASAQKEGGPRWDKFKGDAADLLGTPKDYKNMLLESVPGKCPRCGTLHNPYKGMFTQSGGEDRCQNCGLWYPLDRDHHGDREFAPYESTTKQADNPTPQSELTKAPEDVDTLREEKICPVCGSDMDSEKCEVCGHVEPPDGLNTPDLTKADEFDAVEEATNPDEGQSFLDARKNTDPERVSSRMWEPKINPRLAGRINVQERPLKPDTTPATDEPKESVIKDELKPVTSSTRTAADLVAAAGQTTQENSMSDHRTAEATPADPSGKPDKRVDVTGVGGVIDATNEQASKPQGPHSWENKGTTVDVEGKGGVLEDSNAEASKPSDGTQNVEQVGEKQTSGPTKTFDNSNEPNSAVTDRAVQAAKSGVKPLGGPDVQPQRREDVETVNEVKPQSGTDQWTGTGGNGVTRQADPVTKKVDPNIEVRKSQVTSHIVNAFKLADTEVELGMLDASAKYARVAELENESEQVILARLDTLTRVRTAGLKRQPSLTRLPSLKQAASNEPAPQQKTSHLDDPRLDDALFGG